MRKQDRLLSLIQSLTTAEKKYFVQQANADGQAKSYLKLFEALQGETSYNATDLSRKLGKNKVTLASEKKYLEQVLLRSLRLCHAHENELALMNEMTLIPILMDKKLYATTSELITTLKKTALGFSNYFMLEALHAYEMNLEATISKDFVQSEKDILRAIEGGKQANLYNQLYFDMTAIRIRMQKFIHNRPQEQNKKNLKQIYQLIKSPVLTQKAPILFFDQLRFQTLFRLYKAIPDLTKATFYSQKVLDLYDKDILAVNGNERMYALVTDSLVQLYISNKQFKAAHGLIDKLDNKYYRKLPLDFEKLDQRIIPNVEKARLLLAVEEYVNLKPDKQKAKKALTHFWEKEKELFTAMLPEAWIVTLVAAAQLHLLISEPGAAIDVLIKLVHETDKTIEPTSQAQARLLLILAHQETGNYSVLPSLVSSTKRFYENNQLLTKVETITFKFITQLCKLHDKKEKLAAFKQLEKDYGVISKNKAMKLIIEKTNVMQWVERNLVNADL